MRNLALLALVALALTSVSPSALAASSPQNSRLERPAEDEFIYFLLPDRFENGDKTNDRGGLKGDRLITGYDPTSKGFFNGGDFKGVIQHLDYIQSLGATAVWLAPIFKNKAVQGDKGNESAGYHGYWITDFEHVDPHFGTDADFKKLVDAVHARGMKFYMDIVVNHTADVIKYGECPKQMDCPYRSPADYPYSRQGGVNGKPINDGFLGDAVQSEENFAKLTNPNYAYTVYLPKGEEHAKNPEWLNDPLLYHNRGNTTFDGESATRGDFVGLDDLMTENPRVVKGMIDVFGGWIDRYGVDGFRIDTARFVNPEFMQAFVPAMLARAKVKGITHFHIFGENISGLDGADAMQARHTRIDKQPSVLDFAFAITVGQTLAGNTGTIAFARLFENDALYEGGAATALTLPTFISNHDAGRFAWYVRTAFPKASDAEVLQRVTLAHAMLFTLRGVPTVYYGDEQGFAGIGNDQSARQDMFASKVQEYNETPLVGTKATTATASFGQTHPLFIAIRELAALRAAHPELRRGHQVVRAYSEKPGLLAVSRRDPATGHEILIAYNTSTEPLEAQVEVDYGVKGFKALHGTCAPSVSAPGSYHVLLKPLDFVICSAVP
ncbi:glycosidase [Rhizomicrobium palustre]|uniref:Glycosidase n=1 Tax=Rhizomicrobium palustre TaxID=189966 RepID=A0A846MYT3_9PROT|nr:alpha-amylase family glycosyl hydrolase [Rhizomicrobium palustre]NIK88375.1 glycosidase [Rhizomicrobium palustre]